ncbi:MAG: outer membrane protein assembly factor BamB/Ca2+-binding EF-hand superfamily protein [Verrucomicrobiales bacterium]|jgi:outer membrane protein assembly factor BamB/Ca2+-binding EF-hand superfamily protein
MKTYSTLIILLTASVLMAEDWPQWRGPDADGISKETGLLKQWPEGGPKVVWEVDTVGVGYSSVSTSRGRLWTQGDLNGVEHTICLDEKTGKLLWAAQPGPIAEVLREKVEQAMASVDKDGSGQVEELEAIAQFGFEFNQSDPAEDVDRPMPTASERANRLIKALDQDNSGSLSVDETGRAWSRIYRNMDQSDPDADREALAKKRTEEVLGRYDTNQDGQLTRKEVEHISQQFNANEMDAEKLEKYYFSQERGKDGILTHEEISGYYLETYPGRDGILTMADTKKAMYQKFGGYRNGMGDGPRGNASVEGDRVYVEGGNGDLTCLNFEDGKTIWHIAFSELGGHRPGWGYSESPLIEKDMLIVTPGGEAGTVAALDKMTGKLIWQSSGTTQGAHYSTPVAANIGGIRQIVQFGHSSCFGLDAKDGSLLWEYKNANNGTANCSTPIVHGDHVFASSAYGTGGGLARITDGRKADEVYFEKKMASHHGGLVKVGAHLYSFGNGGLICMDYLSGEIAWTDRSVGKGSLIAADGMLYLLSENHEMALAEARPEAYREHGRFPVAKRGRPSWAHPVISNGRLYIRNQDVLTAYDIRAAAE